MTVHILGTIVAYTVYVNLSSLGDGYTGRWDGGRAFDRTILVHATYYYIGIFLPGFWTPLALGQIVAIATWHAFRDVYLQINRQIFWACNLFPHFLIWSGSSSKEQIIIIFGIFVISFAAKRSFLGHRLTIMSLFLVCLSLAIICFIRPI